MQKKAFNVILIDSVYRNEFLEKYNFTDSYNIDFGSDDSYDINPMKKIKMKKISTKKIQMKKIKCINLFLENTSDLTSIHPE